MFIRGYTLKTNTEPLRPFALCRTQIFSNMKQNAVHEQDKIRSSSFDHVSRTFINRFRSCWNILSKLDLAPVNFHIRNCLVIKLIQGTYNFM